MYRTHIPDRGYATLATSTIPYHPILQSKETLRAKRFKNIQETCSGIIRWTETMSYQNSDFVICKTFDDFSFKITAGTSDNSLPVIKRNGDISVEITAPHEFFDQPFRGLGEHLVVRILDTYELSDGTKVMKTESCDRMDLYNLDRPNVRHIRYYVFRENRKATGLTENAAVKSMGYFMGKEIAREMGV